MNEKTIEKVKFKALEEVNDYKTSQHQIEILHDVRLDLSVELGTTQLTIREILDLEVGSNIELDRLAGEPADLYVNTNHFAKGEVVVINDTFGFRVNDIIDEEENEQ